MNKISLNKLGGVNGFELNTVYVGVDGDYLEVQAALDSITDASESNRYKIKIFPGDFDLNFNTSFL